MIYGTDDRTAVGNTTAAPWSSIVYLEITYPGFQPLHATGVLVGSNDVLTVAHSLYKPEAGGYPTSITIIPGKSGASEPYGASHAIAVQVHPDFVALDGTGPFRDAAPHDYALITLNGTTFAPALPVGVFGQGFITDKLVTSGGYPADKGGDVLYSVSGTVDEPSDDFLIFKDDMDLLGGQSGSPVIYDGTVTGLLSFDSNANYAVRIDAARLADIDFWRSTNDPSEGNDLLYGGPWDETWNGLAGNDTIVGMDGNDTVFGGSGNDDVNGNKGADLVYGDAGTDFVRGGQGNDFVYGGEGDDWHVNGNIGVDFVHGGAGNDRVFGGPGNDYLHGDDGEDTISGDLGDDKLYGASFMSDGDRDTFVFGANSGVDVIWYFEAGIDRLQIEVSYTVVSVDGGLWIDLGNGNGFGMPGISATQLTPDHFLVV